MVLGTPEAKETAEKAGVTEDPQKSGSCLRCHTTGYGESKELFASSFVIEDGVGCETCHGPGSDYRKMKIMKDREAAIAAGLVFPVSEERCRECHNEESPTWDPERITTEDGKKAGFDFAINFDMIKHLVPSK